MIVGIDPGINSIAYAIVDNKGTLKHANILYADTKKPQLDRMLENLSALFKELPFKKTDDYVVEFTMARAGLQNASIIALLAECTGTIFGMYDPNSELALANIWTKGKEKSERHDDLLKTLSKKNLKKLEELLEDHKKNVRHNILDAYGIALWKLGRE